MAVITCVPTDMTSQSIQQHTTPHAIGCKHHTVCPNHPHTQQIAQAVKQTNLPSNQHTIQPTRQATLSHDTPPHHTTPHDTVLSSVVVCDLLWCVVLCSGVVCCGHMTFPVVCCVVMWCGRVSCGGVWWGIVQQGWLFSCLKSCVGCLLALVCSYVELFGSLGYLMGV